MGESLAFAVNDRVLEDFLLSWKLGDMKLQPNHTNWWLVYVVRKYLVMSTNTF